MNCEHPIWIRNRRYFDKKRPSRQMHDDQRSALALNPWDVARQWLLVPCGRCENCLKKQRNDWFVRLERELARCRADREQAIFITITISPAYYERALDDPSWFIRKWNERVRHVIGHSFKHAFFQEFGEHPETGSEPRLHFHGFLFGLNVSYNTLRRAVKKFGFIWLSRATSKRARYVVKYVVKQIQYDGNDEQLRIRLRDRKYTRKYVSAGVGDWLGHRPAPSFRISTWRYSDFKTHVHYDYSIPRYYDRYLKSDDKQRRAILSAASYASCSYSPLVQRVLFQLVERFDLRSAVARLDLYTSQMKRWRSYSRADRRPPDIVEPVNLDTQILDFWREQYCLT